VLELLDGAEVLEVLGEPAKLEVVAVLLLVEVELVVEDNEIFELAVGEAVGVNEVVADEVVAVKVVVSDKLDADEVVVVVSEVAGLVIVAVTDDVVLILAQL
jgi:hypothetical protein